MSRSEHHLSPCRDLRVLLLLNVVTLSSSRVTSVLSASLLLFFIVIHQELFSLSAVVSY